jgi:hypothetical protein
MANPPTPAEPPTWIAEVNTILTLIKQMDTEPNRGPIIAQLRSAVTLLIDLAEDAPPPETPLITGLMTVITALEQTGGQGRDALVQTLWNVLLYLVTPPPVPTRLTLLMPTITNAKGQPMPGNFSLGLDKVATFTLTEMDTTTNTIQPVDPTDVFTAVSADAAHLNAVIDATGSPAGGPALVVNWLVSTTPLLTGVAVTISDSLGNIADTQLFDMVPAAAVPEQIGLDIADVVITSQPVPPAGP